MRFMLRIALQRAVGDGFASALRQLVPDRSTGGFTLGVQDASTDPRDSVRFGAAVGYLLGPANHNAMSGG